MRRFVPEFAKTIPSDAKEAFAGVIWSVYQWQQEMFDGSFETFEMMRRPDTVKIIAIKDGKIVITYQRQPREDWFYDFPGGRHDNPTEDELLAAKRELREETGLTFCSWRLINVEQPFLKIDWLVYTFLATDFEAALEPNHDAGEDIKVEYLDFAELKQMVADGRFKYTRAHDLVKYNSLEDLLSAPELYKY